MKIFFALFFLGALQGLTEFLPVSSSGHLVLFSKIFGIEESLFLSIILHVATLLSVLFVFHKDVFRMIRHPFSKESLSVVVATIPTGLIALVLMPLIKNSFEGAFLPVCFLISAFLLFLCENVFAKKHQGKLDLQTAFFMGLAQGFAIFPGISRSGSTIAAGLMCGKDKKEVAKFSFMMSIPIIILSLVMEIVDIASGGATLNIEVVPTIVSFLTAFLVGVFSIRAMMRLTENSKLKWFSLYLVAASIFSFFVL